MSFRSWVLEMWFFHVEEVLSNDRKIPDYGMKEYFQRNKWFLKRMYLNRTFK